MPALRGGRLYCGGHVTCAWGGRNCHEILRFPGWSRPGEPVWKLPIRSASEAIVFATTLNVMTLLKAAPGEPENLRTIVLFLLRSGSPCHDAEFRAARRQRMNFSTGTKTT
jgi:hypothetical protein